jgi:hypothetical protein
LIMMMMGTLCPTLKSWLKSKEKGGFF